jgi:hypothetical protein
MEVWKLINEHNRYSVSNFGNIRNDTTGKILKPGGTIYSVVHLWNKTGKTAINIHRLVARYFLDEIENSDKMDIDHINRNRRDNRAENLRWVSRGENLRNKNTKKETSTSQLKGVYKRNIKLSKPWVSRISLNGKGIHLGYFKTEEEAFEKYKEFVIANNLNHLYQL